MNMRTPLFAACGFAFTKRLPSVMPRAAERRGVTFIELLCVIALLAVIGIVLTSLLKTTMDVERAETRGFDRLMQTSALTDQFRADVAQAQDTPKTWRDVTANANTLILKMKSDAHIVYVWDKGKLTREETMKVGTVKRTLPLDAGRGSIEFVRSSADPTLLTLRLRTLRDGKAIAGQTLEISAALGGDWR